MKQLPVVIIILNLNGKEFTKNCLSSIKKNTDYKGYRVIVVDNGSVDGSQKMIKSKFKWVDLLENGINRGFSGGNNEGIKYAINKYNPNYFYLLNNDTLVEKKWLSEAIRTMNKNKKIGIVGSKQLTFDGNPAISSGWIKMFGVKYYWGGKQEEVNWVSGAGFLVKKEVFNEIGFLNEIYNPAYYEETDFERRASVAGFKIIHSPKSIFLHKGAATSEKEISNFSELFYRNRFIYFVKNYSLFYFLPRIFLDIYKTFSHDGLSGIKNLFESYNKGYILIKKKEGKIK